MASNIIAFESLYGRSEDRKSLGGGRSAETSAAIRSTSDTLADIDLNEGRCSLYKIPGFSPK